MKKIRLSFLLLCCGSLFAQEQAAPPEAEASASEVESFRYPLQPFDTVSVQVFQQSDLSSTQRISDVGTIALPLVGQVEIAGLTTSEAERKIARAFIDQEFLVDPIVTVQIERFTSQTVTVLGEVNRAGQLVLPEGVREMPIQEIIAMAGDFSDIARDTRVRVERRKPGEEEPKVFVVDVQEIIESTRDDGGVETFPIRAGDIIFVPRRAF